MKARIRNAGNLLLGSILSWPVPAALLIVSFFYYHHVNHLPADSLLWVFFPVVIGNFIIGVLLQKYIRSGFHNNRYIPLLGMIISILLSGYLLVFELIPLSIWIAITIGLLPLLTILAYFAGKPGVFFMSFLGVVILSTIIISYRTLDNLEILYIVRKINAEQEGIHTDTRIVQWKGDSKSGYTLLINGELMLRLTVPEGLQFKEGDRDDPESAGGAPYLFPAMGRELGSLTGSPGSSDNGPYLLILEPHYKQRPDVRKVRHDVELILSHMYSRRQIRDVNFIGEKSIDKRLIQRGLSGPVWTYTQDRGRIPMQFGLYYPDNYENNPVALLIVEPVVDGFPHHPEILSFLKGLEWSE